MTKPACSYCRTVSNLSVSSGMWSFQWADSQSKSDGCLQEILSPVQCCSLQVRSQGGWESRTAQERESPQISKLQKKHSCVKISLEQQATAIYKVNSLWLWITTFCSDSIVLLPFWHFTPLHLFAPQSPWQASFSTYEMFSRHTDG